MLPQLELAFFPSQIFWLFVCFGSLFLFVNYYFFPRMRKMFEKREQKINAENKIFQHNVEEMQALNKKHQKMILDAKAESNTRIKKAEEASKYFIESKKNEIDKKLNQKFEVAKQEMLSQIEGFHNNIEDEIIKSASKIIEKTESRQVSFEDLKSLKTKS